MRRDKPGARRYAIWALWLVAGLLPTVVAVLLLRGGSTSVVQPSHEAEFAIRSADGWALVPHGTSPGAEVGVVHGDDAGPDTPWQIFEDSDGAFLISLKETGAVVDASTDGTLKLFRNDKATKAPEDTPADAVGAVHRWRLETAGRSMYRIREERGPWPADADCLQVTAGQARVGRCADSPLWRFTRPSEHRLFAR